MALPLDSPPKQDVFNYFWRAWFNKLYEYIKGINSATVAAVSLSGEIVPYASSFPELPATSTFTVDFPDITAVFNDGQIFLLAWSKTFTASKITDVWIKTDGAILYEEADLDAWSSMPRYGDYIHLCRVQTSALKVDAVYRRAILSPVVKIGDPLRLTDTVFTKAFYIPTSGTAWSAVAVDKGDVLETSQKELYRVEVAGTLAGEPALPTYDTTMLGGIGGFGLVTSGTAQVQYIGRSTYGGAFKMSSRAGINWYFGNIAAGLMTGRINTQVKNHILACFNKVIRNWLSGVAYSVGMIVAGNDTESMSWECQTAGTSGVSAPFPPGAVAGDTVTDGTVTWMAVGEWLNTADWVWQDTYPTFRTTKYADSHDSYAATLVWLIDRYMTETSDVAWFSTASTHNGMTYDAVLREIIYYNLSTQIASNLTKVFQNDAAPWGGTYAAKFLMDNCEVWAGYRAAVNIYTNHVPDAGYAATLTTFKDGIATGISSLYDATYDCFKYEISADPSTVTGEVLFYPWCMAQLWPALWGVPVDDDYYTDAIDFAHEHYPYWWARNDIDDLMALGAHHGLLSVSNRQDYRQQIIDRVERHHLVTGSSDVYVHDAAYFLNIRDSLTVSSL